MTSITATNTSHNGGDGEANNIVRNGTISKVEAEYNKIKDRHGWLVLYQEIRERCDRESNEKHFGTSESEKPQNRCLNRYRDVNPYDHSRIILHRGKVDYINANMVKLQRAERKYILTQGPLGDTVGHFWLMVWEQNTKAILMLNKLMEKKQVKCHLYWPDRKGPENALKLSEVNLSVEYLRCEEYKNFCCRWFKLTDLESQQSREIIQFHYTTWPDFGIPSSPVAFLQFLKQVRDSGALDTDVGPAVVHCSAGIGRSGTFCLVDCCLVLIDKEGENNVSVQDVLYELRRYRMGLIQTADQLYFSYQAIIKGISLLKDSAFLDYKETPTIPNDAMKQEAFNSADDAPPLPPRTFSLRGADAAGALTASLRISTQNKPLPTIPTSESFNDDLYAGENQKKNKDALNNFIHNEKNLEKHAIDRPLPALPITKQPRDSLVDRDDDYDDDDDDDDESETDSDSNYDTDHDEATTNDRNNANDGSDVDLDKESNINSLRDTENSNKTTPNEVKIPNGAGDISNSITQSSENELKRRKRGDRKTNLEQKVQDMKRKQREAEDSKLTAKKRRREKRV